MRPKNLCPGAEGGDADKGAENKAGFSHFATCWVGFKMHPIASVPKKATVGVTRFMASPEKQIIIVVPPGKPFLAEMRRSEWPLRAMSIPT
jgi:hypothetical protein